MLCRIVADFFHVKSRDGLCHIRMRPWLKANTVVCIPLVQTVFNEGMIFETVAAAKINIVLIGDKIVSRGVDRIRHYVAIPPWESCFPRLYPGHVLNSAGVTETRKNIRFY